MEKVPLKMPILISAVLFVFFKSIAEGFALETAARKRLGSKSFILKQEGGLLKEITSPAELKEMACSYSLRKPGSRGYSKGWKNWKVLAIESIRYDLSCSLPYPVDITKFENLFFRLGVAADIGEMPSFSDPGARSAYALEFFCRARNLADLCVDILNPSLGFPPNFVDAMKESPILAGENHGNENYGMVSLGGGPGFDFLGAAMAASFSAHTFGDEHRTRTLQATVFDYEEGWGDLVDAMDVSTSAILQQSNLSCRWGGKCDITKAFNDPCNSGLLDIVASTDLWTCQYCVAENAVRLRESNFVFFRELFQAAKEGSIFIFTETHPRVWPDFYQLMKDHGPNMEIGFNNNGREMLVHKSANSGQETPSISRTDMDLIDQFERIGKYHERKINSGWERQERKIRGCG